MLASNRPYSISGLRQVKVIPLFITTLRFLPDQQETTGGDEVDALLDSGSLAEDFIAKRVVSQLKLEHHVVSNKSRTVCSGLDCKCYDLSNTLALYVFYFNELLKNITYFKINAIIL